jgi:hypothetical protein
MFKSVSPGRISFALLVAFFARSPISYAEDLSGFYDCGNISVRLTDKSDFPLTTVKIAHYNVLYLIRGAAGEIQMSGSLHGTEGAGKYSGVVVESLSDQALVALSTSREMANSQYLQYAEISVQAEGSLIAILPADLVVGMNTDDGTNPQPVSKNQPGETGRITPDFRQIRCQKTNVPAQNPESFR